MLAPSRKTRALWVPRGPAMKPETLPRQPAVISTRRPPGEAGPVDPPSLEQERLDRANALIARIATCGRGFFSVMKDGVRRISYLELDERGRVWFHDSYSDARIYTHYSGRWRGFGGGGTLKDLVLFLRRFVKEGTQIKRAFGPWPEWMCDGDLWGYGEDMELVRDKARELGISPEVKS